MGFNRAAHFARLETLKRELKKLQIVVSFNRAAHFARLETIAYKGETAYVAGAFQ